MWLAINRPSIGRQQAFTTIAVNRPSPPLPSMGHHCHCRQQAITTIAVNKPSPPLPSTGRYHHCRQQALTTTVNGPSPPLTDHHHRQRTITTVNRPPPPLLSPLMGLHHQSINGPSPPLLSTGCQCHCRQQAVTTDRPSSPYRQWAVTAIAVNRPSPLMGLHHQYHQQGHHQSCHQWAVTAIAVNGPSPPFPSMGHHHHCCQWAITTFTINRPSPSPTKAFNAAAMVVGPSCQLLSDPPRPSTAPPQPSGCPINPVGPLHMAE
ncbi:hypothetical protein BDN67DRAFT_986265 [Paxillus ammoniavirescens]|nr:hypothetical protein BDN67DRAFT_986265 [Paxillus ammoniavirescens]